MRMVFDTNFEDMYLAEAGRAAGAEGGVPRTETDFTPTDLTAYHPADLVPLRGDG